LEKRQFAEPYDFKEEISMTKEITPIHVIGGGLAGSEAAWQIANAGVPVILHEMRPVKKTDAHSTDGMAELVCSNSFRSDDDKHNAVGLLHYEMRMCGSLIMREGENAAVPAGGALAMDRDIFSQGVTKALEEHPLITIEREEITDLPPADWDSVIIATGPLTSTPLAEAIAKFGGERELAFFDAIAPIVHRDSINMDVAWMQSRYDKVGPMGDGKDYINCPMDKEQYYAFVDALVTSEKTEFKDWEKDTPYFEGCMPVEVMAERGPETLRFGPMKPVGLTNPHNPDVKAYAIVQLRQDNALGTLYNMVGFQTKTKYGAQTELFRTIPGLEKAEFLRLGGLHRNTFINAPKLLNKRLQMNDMPRIRFAGQISGCEGYVESASIGLLAGRMAAAEKLGLEIETPPLTTAHGALLNHITGGANADTFQPMNINFGLFPDINAKNAKGRRAKGKDRKFAMTQRAKVDMQDWINNLPDCYLTGEGTPAHRAKEAA
jgi:methylenetetrahydrofolate--tRNA-(uracil-5-)-methyltransferase